MILGASLLVIGLWFGKTTGTSARAIVLGAMVLVKHSWRS